MLNYCLHSFVRVSFIIMLVVMATCLQTVRLHSAEISYGCNEMQCGILIKGDIERGDAQKFHDVIDELKQKGKLIHSVRLQSRGGDLNAGISIGTLVRENLIFTDAPEMRTHFPELRDEPLEKLRERCRLECFSYFVNWPGGNITSSKAAIEAGESIAGKTLDYDPDIMCASACALISLGGVKRTGVIGLHHIYSVKSDENYAALDDLLGKGSNKVADYLNMLRVPAAINDFVFNTPSNELKWVETHPDYSYDRIFYEYIISSCEPLSEKEEKTWGQLLSLRDLGFYWEIDNDQATHREMSAAERDYFASLELKRSTFISCSIRREVDAQRHAQSQ